MDQWGRRDRSGTCSLIHRQAGGSGGQNTFDHKVSTPRPGKSSLGSMPEATTELDRTSIRAKRSKISGARAAVAADPVKVGLRISEDLFLIAKSEWLGGVDRAGALCQELLEAALFELADEAEERAQAWVSGRIDDLEVPSLPEPDLAEDESPHNLTLRLSAEAYTIANKLALRPGKPVSIQRICEPLLERELAARSDAAIKLLNESITRVKAATGRVKRRKGSWTPR